MMKFLELQNILFSFFNFLIFCFLFIISVCLLLGAFSPPFLTLPLTSPLTSPFPQKWKSTAALSNLKSAKRAITF